MKGGKTANGYTIVEVLIFLAVTGALFVLAMLLINGQQNKANFAQGVRDFQASIDDLSNDIINGNFPGDLDTTYKCTLNVNGVPTITLGAGNGQGTNDQCVFLGKVAQVGSGKTVSEYTVVGRRVGGSGNSPVSLIESQPVIPLVSGSPKFVESFDMQGGLTITRIRVAKAAVGAPYDVGAIGFFSSLNANVVTSNEQNPGIVRLVPVRGSNIGDTPPKNITAIINGDKTIGGAWPGSGTWLGGGFSADFDSNPDAIVICLRQGTTAGTGKRAALILGQNNTQAKTELHIDDIDSSTTGTQKAIAGFTCPA